MIARRSRMLCSSSTTSTRMSAIEARQGDGEGAAESGTAVDVDLTAMILDDAVDQSQSESTPIGLRREEWLEDLGEVGGGDPLAGVVDAQHQPPPGRAHRNAQLTALRHRLDRVDAQVPYGLPELLAVDGPGERGRKLAHRLQRARRGLVLEKQ